MEDFFRAAAGSKMKQDKGGMPEAPACLRFTPSGNAVRGCTRCYVFGFVLRFVSPEAGKRPVCSLFSEYQRYPRKESP